MNLVRWPLLGITFTASHVSYILSDKFDLNNCT